MIFKSTLFFTVFMIYTILFFGIWFLLSWGYAKLSWKYLGHDDYLVPMILVSAFLAIIIISFFSDLAVYAGWIDTKLVYYECLKEG